MNLLPSDVCDGVGLGFRGVSDTGFNNRTGPASTMV